MGLCYVERPNCLLFGFKTLGFGGVVWRGLHTTWRTFPPASLGAVERKSFSKIYTGVVETQSGWYHKTTNMHVVRYLHIACVCVCVCVCRDDGRISGKWSMAAINVKESRCVCEYQAYVLTRWYANCRRWSGTVMPGTETVGIVGRKLESLHKRDLIQVTSKKYVQCFVMRYSCVTSYWFHVRMYQRPVCQWMVA